MIARGWRLVPIILFLLLSLFLWRGLSQDPHYIPSVQIGRPFPSFKLPDLQQLTRVVNSKQFKGKVSLVNVWASWCQSCIDEQVFMLELARQGVTIYGINYKDNPHDALQWLAQWGNPFKRIAVDREGKVAIDLGVYGAPETFVIDKKGIIRYRHPGIMNQQLWRTTIRPLILQLEQSA